MTSREKLSFVFRSEQKVYNHLGSIWQKQREAILGSEITSPLASFKTGRALIYGPKLIGVRPPPPKKKLATSPQVSSPSRTVKSGSE